MTVAVVLAKNNFNVALFYNKSIYKKRNCFGETLSSSVIPDLVTLGLSELFEQHKFELINKSISSWGAEGIEETSNLLNPTAFGWLIRRNDFENCFLNRIKHLNIDFYEDSTENIELEDGNWRIYSTGKSEIKTDLVVLATGRDNVKLNNLPRRIILDKLVACVFVISDNNTNLQNSIYVDAAENGWFFSIKPDQDSRILSYFTDGDLLPNKTNRFLTNYVIEQIKKLPSISKIIKSSDFDKINSLDLVSANSTFRKTYFHKGILMCGDSSQTFDPLSSQGISKAIKDGIGIADSIIQSYFGNKNAFKIHETNRRKIYQDYIKQRCQFYMSEKRWKNMPFWSRRQDLKEINTFVNNICK